jgi:hypothetical protein
MSSHDLQNPQNRIILPNCQMCKALLVSQEIEKIKTCGTLNVCEKCLIIINEKIQKWKPLFDQMKF